MVSQENVLYDKERRQTIKEHSKIAQLLKLSCRDVKIMIKILKNSVWKVDNMSKVIENWSPKKIQKSSKWKCCTEKDNIRIEEFIKSLTGRLGRAMRKISELEDMCRRLVDPWSQQAKQSISYFIRDRKRAQISDLADKDFKAAINMFKKLKKKS